MRLPSDRLAFAAGALAATLSKSYHVGAVLGPVWPRSVADEIDGFIAGVESVDPTTQVDLENDPNDVPLGYQGPTGATTRRSDWSRAAPT